MFTALSSVASLIELWGGVGLGVCVVWVRELCFLGSSPSGWAIAPIISSIRIVRRLANQAIERHDPDRSIDRGRSMDLRSIRLNLAGCTIPRDADAWYYWVSLSSIKQQS